MSNRNNTPQCPICKKEIEFSARYGNYVCNECIDSGTFTKNGRRIRHGNVDFTGGFVSLIEGETKKGNEHYCYIKRGDNIYKIYADEARFGGIVYHLCNDQD